MIRIMRYGEIPDEQIFFRGEIRTDVEGIVADILKQVRERGDEAVLEYCSRFDGGVPEPLEVSPREYQQALDRVDRKLLDIMQAAANNIRDYHRHQVRQSYIVSEKNGVVLGQKVIPIEKVGLYAPGGTAAYPSTVLMDAVPAKLAGVNELIMVTPAKGGKVNPVILAAAWIAGVDRVFKVGGAQAVAALAYGTRTIPRVDKIVGPGNAFVTEAKKQVFGQVAIDMIAGPSEILIVADAASDPRHVAADMLSQAEHDKMAAAVLVTDSEKLAHAVAAELEKQLQVLPREEIARTSINDFGKIILCDDLQDAVKVANAIAPEHLELCVDQPFDWLDRIKNAGSVFMGRYCPEALGDYYGGPNHVLPTLGTARFSSPLSVDDFVKKTQFTYYTAEALKKVCGDVACFARAEGLEAHARSAESRFDGEDGK
ncbi:MAG: histidinol dehydrogenase [Clostridia bacterium]|nr:histidinol dehydrogenase [Clostridia bacterium]